MNAKYLKNWYVLPCMAGIVAQIALVSTCAGASSEDRGHFSRADYKFARAAACGGKMEVNLGRIAEEKSSNPAVQVFGRRMAKDHRQAGEDLEKIATRRAALLPMEPTPSQQREIDRLAKLSGPEFDVAYVSLMVRDHKADRKEFKRASENIEDPELRAFAANTLAVVQEHLRLAEDLEAHLRHEVTMER